MSSPLRSERNLRVLTAGQSLEGTGRRALNGTMIAFSGQIIRIFIQFASVAILARLISPQDFGLVAMAATVASFVSMFSDMGLATATLQRKEITQSIVSALLFVNIAVGLALMAITIAIAPIAAWVFNDSRVTLLSICLAMAIPIAALGAQHGALLGRAMRWLPIQLAWTLGQIAGVVAAILLIIFADAGYWALAAQGVVTAGVLAAGNRM